VLQQKQKKETAEKYTYERRWGTKGAGDSQFKNPHSLAIDLLGNVYITDTGNNRVEKFSTVDNNPKASISFLLSANEDGREKLL
jgi:DNA-binding beta-propeller fold protein YncE